MVLESWMGSRRVQEVAARFQGIPSWVLLELPEGGYGGPGGLVFHQARAEDDPRGLVLHRAVWERSWRPGMIPGRCRCGPGGLV